MDKGKLYVVATPIGNLKDITLRAIDILGQADIVAAEDTRRTGILLKHYGIKTRLLSYHEYSSEKKDNQVIALLDSGKNIALVSDAGTPLISDPGYPIVKAAREAGIDVVSVPGPCAAIAALSASAVGDGRFVFWGFLDSKSSVRQKQLQAITRLALPVVLYESPHRLLSVLKDIRKVCGESAQVTTARELTKIYEEYFFGNVEEAIAHFEQNEPRGEFVLILECAMEEEAVTDEQIRALLSECAAKNMTKKDAVAWVAERLHLPKNRIYKISLG